MNPHTKPPTLNHKALRIHTHSLPRSPHPGKPTRAGGSSLDAKACAAVGVVYGSVVAQHGHLGRELVFPLVVLGGDEPQHRV